MLKNMIDSYDYKTIAKFFIWFVLYYKNSNLNNFAVIDLIVQIFILRVWLCHFSTNVPMCTVITFVVPVFSISHDVQRYMV